MTRNINEEGDMAEEEWIDAGTYKYGNVTVHVRKPVLTAPERARREQQAKDTMARVMREYIHNKEGKQHAEQHQRNG